MEIGFHGFWQLALCCQFLQFLYKVFYRIFRTIHVVKILPVPVYHKVAAHLLVSISSLNVLTVVAYTESHPCLQERRSPLAGSTWSMLPPDLCTIPWEHSLSSGDSYNFSFFAPQLLQPAFSDGQGVLLHFYEPLPILLGTLSSAWCLHLAAYLGLFS